MEKFTKPEVLNFLCDEGLGQNPDFLSLENATNGTDGGSH